MFSLSLFGVEPRYIRRARAYLEEARMAMLEHTIAAENYQASAAMYAERARRLEGEIALWEAGQKDADVMEPVYEGAPTSAEHGRLESSSKHVLPKGKSAVGIVRAA
ncbi:hypothetical protein [Comamonas sp. NoAH]|uniref:hypothetical protein n=1 Tax=Comamonas halotolerans TaxID=3041496 RepID=UPI0024E0430C|nr:hypothetical protein [Comamonas sp. NoAH]